MQVYLIVLIKNQWILLFLALPQVCTCRGTWHLEARAVREFFRVNHLPSSWLLSHSHAPGRGGGGSGQPSLAKSGTGCPSPQLLVELCWPLLSVDHPSSVLFELVGQCLFNLCYYRVHRFCEETEIHAYTKAIFSQMSHPIYLLYYCQRNSLQNAI